MSDLGLGAFVQPGLTASLRKVEGFFERGEGALDWLFTLSPPYRPEMVPNQVCSVSNRLLWLGVPPLCLSCRGLWE